MQILETVDQVTQQYIEYNIGQIHKEIEEKREEELRQLCFEQEQLHFRSSQDSSLDISRDNMKYFKNYNSSDEDK
jgi:hypothetical protein